MQSKYFNLRGRTFSLIGGSLLRRRFRVTLDATAHCRWIRIGLLPGTGRFLNHTTIASFASLIWVRAPESRTAAVQSFAPAESVAEASGPEAAPAGATGRVVRWGLMSTARINRALIPPIRSSERSRLAAVASRDGDRARRYARAWDIAASYGSYEELLADPTVDVVYISLPNHLHVEWTIRSLEAGKHVLCEKPLALTPADVDRLAEAVDRTGKNVAEAFMYRHHARTLRVKQEIDNGRIGEVQHMEGAFSFMLDNPTNIRMDADMGGGSLWDVGCYPVSFARFIMGAEPVTAFGRQVLGESGVDEVFSGQLVFPNEVSLQFVSGFRVSPRMEMRIVGTEGVIFLPEAFKPGASSDIVVTHGSREERIRVSGRPLYVDEVEDMNDVVLENSVPRISLDDSKANVRALAALYRAAKNGQAVAVGE